MAYTASAVIAEARKWEGYLEKKSVGNDTQMQDKTWNPGSNNITWFWTYLKRKGCLSLQGGAWCDGFNDFIHVIVAGVDKARKSLNGFSGYTPDSSNRYKQAGRWIEPNGNVKPGDQIFFKGYVSSEGRTRIYHTGIVVKVTSDRIYTIEGNTSSAAGVVENGGCVREKSYARNYSKIAGYGRPLYDSNEDSNEESNSSLNKNGGKYMFEVSDLVKGSKGAEVKLLQRLLVGHGYSVGSAGVDGDFGTETEGAVKMFQKDNDIKVNYPGTVGSKTWSKLLGI